MGNNNDYELTVYGYKAFEDNKAYKLLKREYGKTDAKDKINNANFNLQYISGIDRFYIFGYNTNSKNEAVPFSYFVRQDNHTPIYQTYVIGDEDKKSMTFSVYIRVDDGLLYLVFTQSLLEPYDIEEKKNTRIITKYPLHYVGAPLKEILEKKRQLGWTMEKISGNNEDLYDYEDVFGEAYSPHTILEEENNGIVIRFK